VALMPPAENPENSQCDDAQGERHDRAGGCLRSHASVSVSAISRAIVSILLLLRIK